MFALEIRTPRGHYTTRDAIPIAASLTYLGPQVRTIVSGSSQLVVFALEQIDGPLDNGGGNDDMCAGHPMTAGEPVAVPFAKSGGWEPDRPLAAFWEAYFSDKDLHLPAGLYRITASLYAIAAPSCIGPEHKLRATVSFRVDP